MHGPGGTVMWAGWIGGAVELDPGSFRLNPVGPRQMFICFLLHQDNVT